MRIHQTPRQGEENAVSFCPACVQRGGDVCAKLAFPTVKGIGDIAVRNGSLFFSLIQPSQSFQLYLGFQSATDKLMILF